MRARAVWLTSISNSSFGLASPCEWVSKKPPRGGRCRKDVRSESVFLPAQPQRHSNSPNRIISEINKRCCAISGSRRLSMSRVSSGRAVSSACKKKNTARPRKVSGQCRATGARSGMCRRAPGRRSAIRTVRPDGGYIRTRRCRGVARRRGFLASRGGPRISRRGRGGQRC